MIIMHYRFTLPGDYDMGIIEQRIRLNGARLDGFPGLVAKAYLYACREDGGINEHRYAPLYFWREASGMQRFLQSPGFAALVRDFGWPIIESWLAFEEQTLITDLAEARFMTLNRWTIPPHANLATLPIPTGFSAWDVTRWQGLTVNASQQRPASGPEVYRIGYLARGAAASDLQL